MGIINKKGSDLDFFNMLIKGMEYKNPEHIKACKETLQAFVGEPKKLIKQKIQAMQEKIQSIGIGVSTDFPFVTTDSFNVTIQEQTYDMGWEQVFKQVVLDKGKFYWEIYDVANSLTFFKVEEGQKLEAAGLSGTKLYGEVEYYGGAIGWTDKMIQAREIPAMIDLANIFRNKFWVMKANTHYALISTAAALTVVPWQGVAADGRSLRDLLTVGVSQNTLALANLNKGYGDMANAPMIIIAHNADEQRLEAAFKLSLNNIVGARENAIEAPRRRITRVYTYDTNILPGFPLMILPGQKSQKADAMAPTTYGPELDILSLNRIQSVWAIFGATIADSDQFLTLTLGNP
jgi:hypothetical protein